jgi:hypothetical protein
LIDRLREVKPTRVYVAADGARSHIAGEPERCVLSRAIINEIDWPCEIHRKFCDTNQGCRWGPVNAINWFFEHEKEGIILEDDILPDPSFFRFCTEMLERHRDSTMVGCICGYNFLPQTGTSYFFSRIPLTWGWATWRDRWQNFAKISDRFNHHLRTLNLRCWLSRYDERDMKRKLREAYSEDHVWDFLWMFALWCNNQLTVLPAQSLTQNIGIGENATHTFVPTCFTQAEAKAVHFPLHHPENIAPNTGLDRAIFRQLLHTPTPWERAEAILRSERPLNRFKKVILRRINKLGGVAPK